MLQKWCVILLHKKEIHFTSLKVLMEAIYLSIRKNSPQNEDFHGTETVHRTSLSYDSLKREEMSLSLYELLILLKYLLNSTDKYACLLSKIIPL